jgi:hypothetical protein
MGTTMLHATAVVLALVQAAQPFPRAGELVSERTEGVRRVCVYANPQAAPPQPAGRRQRLIGRGEPCPRRDPGPPPPRPQQIPSLAMLAGDRLLSSRRICIYRYLSREYLHQIRADQRCPLTPHFFD